MNRQAASFAKGFTADDEDSEEERESNEPGAAAARSLEDGAPECIFCREKSGDAMGYLAFMQSSSMVKRALHRHSDCKEMQSVYRVVALQGCKVTASASDGSKLVGHVAHGEHVLVGSRAGRWMRVVSPLVGWIPLYQRLAPLPKEIDFASRTAALLQPERHQRLLNTHEGPDGQSPAKAALEVVLHPVHDLQFNHFGGERIHGMLPRSLLPPFAPSLSPEFLCNIVSRAIPIHLICCLSIDCCLYNPHDSTIRTFPLLNFVPSSFIYPFPFPSPQYRHVVMSCISSAMPEYRDQCELH